MLRLEALSEQDLADLGLRVEGLGHIPIKRGQRRSVPCAGRI